MKISCQSCEAKYTIADEKVAGKVVKIKCKKCGSTIVVNGNDAAAAPANDPSAYAQQGDAGGEEEGSTRVFGGEGAPGGAPSDEWTVNVTDDDQRSMTSAQLVMEYQRGVVNGDTYVWKDGMADWLPILSVPELADLVSGAAPAAPRQVSAPPAAASVGLGGTVMMDQSPAAAPRAAAAAGSAARRAGGRAGGVDLFGGGGGGAAAPAPAQSPPESPHDRAVGERNENSVLFSLSALTAAENAAKATKGKGDDAIIDMRPSNRPAPPRNNGRAGFDDIMNLGGGGLGGSSVLAPPPLLAPVVEAPPPPPPVQAMAPMQAPYAMAPMAPPAKKGGAGLIIGIVLGLAVIGGVGFFFLRGTTAAPPATGEQTSTTATPTSAPAATAAPAETVAAATTGAPADTTAPAVADTGAPVAAATGAPPVPGKPADPKPGQPIAAKPEKPADKPADKPAEAKPAETKPAETAPPAAGGAEFSRGAASAALGAAAGSARGCKKPDGPTGSGKVRVTFAPSGNVTSATVQGPPFAGTSVGGCIASAFRSARVPPFSGDPVSVTKSFSIN